MAKVKFKRIENSSDIGNMDIENGSFIVTGDGKNYADFNNTRVPINGTPDAPVGVILSYAGSIVPDGWLLCDGSPVSRTTYSYLYSIIGDTYGNGDGLTTFNLPNLKGNVPIGLNDDDTDFNTLGAIGGEKTHTLTIDEMPSHSHDVTINANGTTATPIAGIANTGNATVNGNLVGGSAFGIKNKGGGQAHNILQPYIVLNYIIKY